MGIVWGFFVYQCMSNGNPFYLFFGTMTVYTKFLCGFVTDPFSFGVVLSPLIKYSLRFLTMYGVYFQVTTRAIIRTSMAACPFLPGSDPPPPWWDTGPCMSASGSDETIHGHTTKKKKTQNTNSYLIQYTLPSLMFFENEEEEK